MSIYFFLDSMVYCLDLSSNPDQLYKVLISCSFIPVGLVGIRLLLNESLDIFFYLDGIFNKSQSAFSVSFRNGIRDIKTFIILALSIGLPIVFLTWNGLPYYDIGPENPFERPQFLAVDIYDYLILWFTIFLLCIIIWIQINASLAFHRASESLKGQLQNYNLLILLKKLELVRNYFHRYLIYFTIFIGLINLSILGLKVEITYSAVFLILLFIFGVSLTLRGLNDTQRIINAAAEENLDAINNSLVEKSNRLLSILAGSEENKDEAERLQKIIELKKKEWDNIAQIKVGLDMTATLKEVGTFMISIIIPVISFLISPEIRNAITP